MPWSVSPAHSVGTTISSCGLRLLRNFSVAYSTIPAWRAGRLEGVGQNTAILALTDAALAEYWGGREGRRRPGSACCSASIHLLLRNQTSIHFTVIVGFSWNAPVTPDRAA